MNTEELHRPLSGAERDELGAFLESSPTAMPFPRADGFLTAAASAPTMMPPSQWHPLLLGDHTFESNREAERILGLLLRRWNEIVARLEAGRQASPSTSSNDEDLRAWCQGYLEASRLDPQWMADDRGVDELLPFGVLAGEFDLVGETASDGAVIEDDSAHVHAYRASLRRRVLEIHDYWLRRRRAQLRRDASPTSLKIRRNAPCPCGSGRKYKLCCGLR